MSIVDYIKKQEYIVTVKNFNDLDAIYDEIETQGKSPPTVELDRPVHCLHKKPTSRNTHYLLAEWEALELAKDPRILSVELAPHLLGIKPSLSFDEQEIIASEENFDNSIDITSSIQQTSSGWDKSSSTSNTMRNWALLRCSEGTQRSGWGGTGYEGGGTGTPSQTGTVTLSQIGRNVDVVICDENGIVWNHPEYAVNADGTGGTRTVQYNWFQHDPVVRGQPAGTYSYGTGAHSTHVAGTVAGNTQGWARGANIYNIYYLAGDPGTGEWNFGYVMDYVREFHRTKSVNPTTGRKNPTIVNNSWGMSIFPSEWTFSDITAVTYRGVRYTPAAGATTYTGYSGVCTSNQRLATLLGEENFGNRITTTGPYIPPAGFIASKPASWSQQGQQAYLTQFTAPDNTYTITVDGPADLDLIHNIGVDSVSGQLSLEGEIIIYDSSSTELARFTGGPVSSANGGTIEFDIRETYSLPNNEVYTLIYNTVYTAPPGAQFATAMSVTVITESTPATATVTSITNTLLGAASLTPSTTPTNVAENTTNPNDDAYWALNLPFPIEYLGNTYSTIYVSTNHYLTFGGGSFNYSSLGPANPNLPKIMWSCADNSVQRIYYGTEGIAPNRTYRVRLEGNASTSGTLGNPGMVNEYVFYEATPAQIDLQLGVNNRKTTSSGFTTNQLNQWGFIAGQRIPSRVTALDVDLEDAYNEGIIQVGAAGNGRWKHDVPGGLDWDNTFEMANRYPGSVSQPYYYMRGTSPTANDNLTSGQYDLPAICVGSVDTVSTDQKVIYSDCGPGVDIWAPGTYIISSLNSGVSDSRTPGGITYFLGKYSGTSMASPQVCGVIACALEKYPHWNQRQAKAYITGIAKSNQLTGTNGGPADGQDLQGAPNLFLYYKIERPTTGMAFPSLTNNPRPATGALYPRTRIRRTL